MDNPAVMRASQGARNLNPVPHHRFKRKSRIESHGAQRFALDKLHYDVQFPIGLADFVNSADIRMSERRGGTRFVQQILAGRGIQAGIFMNDFYGDIAVQYFVVRAINNAHPSFADLRGDPVVTQFLSDHVLSRSTC
jgi:hypothetical protein